MGAVEGKIVYQQPAAINHAIFLMTVIYSRRKDVFELFFLLCCHLEDNNSFYSYSLESITVYSFTGADCNPI